MEQQNIKKRDMRNTGERPSYKDEQLVELNAVYLNKIRLHIEKNNMTLKDFALLTGITYQSLSNLLRYNKIATTQMLVAIKYSVGIDFFE